jgi:hypothetical protein
MEDQFQRDSKVGLVACQYGSSEASRGRGGSVQLAGLKLIASFPRRGSLGSLLPKSLAGVAFVAVSLTLTVLPAHAAASAPAGSTGYDISWPQCASSFPAGGSFAIVGVTNGLAFSANPCLGAEYVWASGLQYAAGLYINTGNPETASSNWPGRAGGTFPRTCNTPAELADPSNVDCAYNYGWNAATDALNVATANVGPAALTLPWWLDVEIANSWNGIGGANSSTVQGYIDYLRGQRVGTVGIYSTGYQWGQITGGYTVASVPDWLAGASNVTQAASMCDPANSFSGGPVQLVQYPSGGFDGNYVCGVSVAQPDFSLSASPSSQTVTQGAGTRYTITVTPTNGFTGTVALSAAGLPAGAAALYNPASVTTSGNSTLTVTTASNTPTGTFTVTTTGSSGSLTHAAGVTLVVNAPADYSLSVSPGSVTVAAGSPASYTVSINRIGGFTGGVQFSTSTLPAGAVASFSPNPGTTNSSTLSITTTTTTPPGTYPVTVTGTSGALSHTASPTLVVTSAAAGNYSLSATPSSRSITRGNSGSYTVTIARTGGFTGAVTFSVNGLPSGTSFSFSPNPSTGTGTTTTLNISTAQATPTGTYVLTITGVSGSMTRAVTVTMVVRRH